MSYDVVTIGSATVDYFADTDSELISIDTRVSNETLLAFPLGGKVLIRELQTTTGGGGTNTAVAFARLGFNTAFLGKLGDDVLGDLILKKLEDEHVAFIGARAGQTGVSFVLNSIRNDRTILAHKGANDFLQKADVPTFDTRWVYLSSMLEQSWTTASELVAQGNYKLAFNPSGYQAALGYVHLRSVIERAVLLVMNREEACALLGFDPRRRMATADLIGTLAKIPGQIVAITDGANGAWLCQDTTLLSARPVADLHILETTGAGDAFAATLTACLMRSSDLTQALHFAMTNAESELKYKGTKEKLLSWQELEATAAAHPREIRTHVRSTNRELLSGSIP